MINSVNSAEVDVNLDNAESNLSLKLIPRIKSGRNC